MTLKAKWRTVECCDGKMHWDYSTESGEECVTCGGSTRIFILPNGAIADYPGGPFRGNWGPEEYAKGKDYAEIDDAEA